MKRKKTNGPPRPHNEDWHCDTCNLAILDGRTSMIEHMKQVHHMPEKCTAKKSLVMALDGADFYSNTFEWEWPSLGVKATQHSAGPRDKEYWGDE